MYLLVQFSFDNVIFSNFPAICSLTLVDLSQVKILSVNCNVLHSMDNSQVVTTMYAASCCSN